MAELVQEPMRPPPRKPPRRQIPDLLASGPPKTIKVPDLLAGGPPKAVPLGGSAAADASQALDEVFGSDEELFGSASGLGEIDTSSSAERLLAQLTGGEDETLFVEEAPASEFDEPARRDVAPPQRRTRRLERTSDRLPPVARSPSESQRLKAQQRPGPSDSQRIRPQPGPSESQRLRAQRKPGPSESQRLKAPRQPGPSDSQRIRPQPGPSESQRLKAPRQPGPSDSQRIRPQPGPSDSQRLKAPRQPGPSDSQRTSPQPGPSDSQQLKAAPPTRSAEAAPPPAAVEPPPTHVGAPPPVFESPPASQDVPVFELPKLRRVKAEPDPREEREAEETDRDEDWKGDGVGPAVLRALHEFTQPQSSGELYARVVDLAVEVSGADRGFLTLLEQGDKIRFKFGRSVDRATLMRERETSRTIIRDALQSGQTVEIADTSEAASMTDSMQGVTPRSVLCVPLVFGWRELGTARAGGVLYLDCRALTQQFRPGARRLVETVADHAAGAIDLHRERDSLRQLDPESRRLNQNFSRLLDVGLSFGSTFDTDHLLRVVMEKALEVTRAERGFLLLREADAEPSFRLGLRWQENEGEGVRRLVPLRQEQIQYDEALTYTVFQEERTVLVDKADKEARDGLSDSRSIAQLGLTRVVVAPLMREGRLLGLIYVDSSLKGEKAFAASDVRLFEALAAQAALGIENARLFGQVAAQQRLESEIALAAEIQNDLCPKQVPEIRGIQLTGVMQAAREVGGDYYDFVPDSELPEQVLSIVIGDVSGKGLGAGMVAVMARCFLRPMLGAYGTDDPQSLLAYLNYALVQETKPGKFMTMLLVVWDARISALRYSSAGHENIIVWRAETAKAEVIASGGTPLGLSTTLAGPTVTRELHLHPLDTVVFYTDGVTEAMNPRDEEFTLERLTDLVTKVGGRTIGAVQQAILRELKAHRGRRDVSDDITLVVLRRTDDDLSGEVSTLPVEAEAGEAPSPAAAASPPEPLSEPPAISTALPELAELPALSQELPEIPDMAPAGPELSLEFEERELEQPDGEADGDDEPQG